MYDAIANNEPFSQHKILLYSEKKDIYRYNRHTYIMRTYIPKCFLFSLNCYECIYNHYHDGIIIIYAYIHTLIMAWMNRDIRLKKK